MARAITGACQSDAVATFLPFTNTTASLSAATTTAAAAAAAGSVNLVRRASFAACSGVAAAFDQIHFAAGGVASAAPVSGTNRCTLASNLVGAAPVSCQMASVNCSAVIRRGSGPLNT